MLDLPVLRKGDYGPDVNIWQTFLKEQGFYAGVVDGDFGNKTHNATKRFQSSFNPEWSVVVDGRVSEQTWGLAMLRGWKFDPELFAENFGEVPIPNKLSPVSHYHRNELFGELRFKHTPTSRNREAITITNGWNAKYLTKVEVPQLKKLYIMRGPGNGFPQNGKVFWHKEHADTLLKFFEDIEREKALKYILTWAGTWAPRLVRHSTTTLSNHAYATAFDINAAWNGLGRKPAGIKEKGTVIPIARLAEKHRFWWGGWGWGNRSRLDGMHFEIGSD